MLHKALSSEQRTFIIDDRTWNPTYNVAVLQRVDLSLLKESELLGGVDTFTENAMWIIM